MNHRSRVLVHKTCSMYHQTCRVTRSMANQTCSMGPRSCSVHHITFSMDNERHRLCDSRVPYLAKFMTTYAAHSFHTAYIIDGCAHASKHNLSNQIKQLADTLNVMLPDLCLWLLLLNCVKTLPLAVRRMCFRAPCKVMLSLGDLRPPKPDCFRVEL